MNRGRPGPRERVVGRMRRAMARGSLAGGMTAVVGIGCVDAAPQPSCSELPQDQHATAEAAWLTTGAGAVHVRLTLNGTARGQTFGTAVTAVGATVVATRVVPGRTDQGGLEVELLPDAGMRFIDVDAPGDCSGTAETLRWRLDVSAGTGAAITVTRR